MNLNETISSNQNLIYSIAHYFNGYSNKEDLFQVGCIGLIKASQKFDDSIGVKFTTYAYPYILGEMKKYIREDKGIKISRDISKLNLMIEKAHVLLSQKLMREPSTIELSDYLEIDQRYVVEAINSVNVLQSMDDVIITKDNDISLHDLIGAKESTDINVLISLKQELMLLTPFEKELINARYMEDLTQSETAKKLGMSQVQVSRKEQKTLVKLRDKLIC